MTSPSKSPERHTFQKENYIKRQEEAGTLDDPDTQSMIKYYESWKEEDERKLNDPEWQKYNMEYDLRTTDWILEKVRSNKNYAQHLYAAMCNNEFIKREMWPILKEQTWSCSWRHSGGILADMRQEGDYMDWYCSGIKGVVDPPYYGEPITSDHVPESQVTEEIEADLYKLGWLVVKYDDTKDI